MPMYDPFWDEPRGYYYDVQGNPMSLRDWAASFEHDRHIRESTVRGLWVSTIWTGIHMDFLGGPPRVFETMVFDGSPGRPVGRYGGRWAGLRGAEIGHEKVIEQVEQDWWLDLGGRA